MPLLQRMRAKGLLPSPARRRAIRDAAKLSREDIARELRARGYRVTKNAVEWWEKPRPDGGVDPRPATAIVYMELLMEIAAELETRQPRDPRDDEGRGAEDISTDPHASHEGRHLE